MVATDGPEILPARRGVAGRARTLEASGVRVLVAIRAHAEANPTVARWLPVALWATDLCVTPLERVSRVRVVEVLDAHLGPVHLVVAGLAALAETRLVRILVAAAARGGRSDPPCSAARPGVAGAAGLARVRAAQRPSGERVIEVGRIAAWPANHAEPAPAVIEVAAFASLPRVPDAVQPAVSLDLPRDRCVTGEALAVVDAATRGVTLAALVVALEACVSPREGPRREELRPGR